MDARHALECVYLQKSQNRKKGGGQNISDIKGVVLKSVGIKYKGWG